MMNNKSLTQDSNISFSQTGKDKHGKPDSLKRFIPFYFYIPTIIGSIALAVKSGEQSLYLIAVLLIIGWFCWGLFEYTFHRFVLHHSRKGGINLPGNETHLTHHRNPKSLERLYVPLHEGLPIALAYFLVAGLVTGSWQITAYLYTGFILGYLFYELLDYEAHHGKSKLRFVRYYRKYHLQHHFADESARYGVTSPVFDYLFGTYKLKLKRVNRTKKAGVQS